MGLLELAKALVPMSFTALPLHRSIACLPQNTRICNHTTSKIAYTHRAANVDAMQTGSTTSHQPSLLSTAPITKSVGCIIAGVCGDVLGAAVEGWTADRIRQEYSMGLLDFKEERGLGCYTDDTEMTLALAKSIVKSGKVDAAAASTDYAAHYHGYRGYGESAHKVMALLINGAHYSTTGRAIIPDGSFGNGGAMRIAPLAIAYRHASPQVIHSAVVDALVCTHVHPAGIDGAYIQALALAWLLQVQDPAAAQPQQLLQHLHRLAVTEEMRHKLERLQAALAGMAAPGRPLGVMWQQHLQSPAFEAELHAATLLAEPFQIKATDAEAVALLALCCHWASPEDAIIAALHYGGDTDTVAAMVGNLAGALHGGGWLPQRWWRLLENEPGTGRDELARLAGQLWDMDLREWVVSEHME